MGTKYIIKDRRNAVPGLEPENTQFLRSTTTIPVPKVIAAWNEGEDSSMRITERIDGTSLDVAWPSLTQLQKWVIAKETAEYLTQLQELQSDRMHSLSETGQLYSELLFPASGISDPVGPLYSDDELWEEMAKSLKRLPMVAAKLRRSMPPAAPYTFTHGDLSAKHIMVKDGNLTGIIGWELSGYFPTWWEFASTFQHESWKDMEWKRTLREYMVPHPEAADFWLAFNHMCAYPNLDEDGEAYLKELENVDNYALSFSEERLRRPYF